MMECLIDDRGECCSVPQAEREGLECLVESLSIAVARAPLCLSGKFCRWTMESDAPRLCPHDEKSRDLLCPRNKKANKCLRNTLSPGRMDKIFLSEPT